MRRVSKVLPIHVIIAIILGTTSCGDGPSEPPVASAELDVLKGAGGADTVLARLPDTLVVEVRKDGVPIPNLEVRFLRLDPPTQEPYYDPVSFMTLRWVGQEGMHYRGVAVDTTDEDGRVHAFVAFGSDAGEVRAEISAPTLSLADTISFTVFPGAPDSVTLSPGDTAVQAGRSYHLIARVVDRWGNDTGEPAAVEADSPALATIAANGDVVQALSLGRAAFTARFDQFATRALLSVVPPGRMSYFTSNGGEARLETTDLDGSLVQSVALPAGHSPKGPASWNGAGDRVAFVTGSSALGRDVVAIMDPQGMLRVVLADQIHQAISVAWRGDWLYIAADAPDGEYRWLRSGGNFDSVEPLSALSSCLPGTLSPAPDHQRYVYDCGAASFVRTVGQDGADLLKEYGITPQWSPEGGWIAYSVWQSGLSVIRPDGTGERLLFPGYGAHFFWSPASDWLLVNAPVLEVDYETPHLVRVQDGLALPLPTARQGKVAWRP